MTIEPGVMHAPELSKRRRPMNSHELLNILSEINKDVSDLKEAIDWVTTPHPDLGMQCPADADWDVVYNLITRNRQKSA